MMTYRSLSTKFSFQKLFRSCLKSNNLIKLGFLLLVVSMVGITGCEDSKASECTVNSDCGHLALCRANACRPKCQTYLTCAEGEACVDGACEIPSADYCSHVVPAQTPPEMGPYAPCPPSELNVGAGETMMTPAGMMSGAGVEMVTPAGEQTAGELSMAGVQTAGEQTAGESSMAGTFSVVGGMSSGESAGESAGSVGGEIE